jgi:peptide/nickel transport system substrate-binding protein
VRVTTSEPWVDFDGYLFSSGRLGMMAQAQLDDAESCADNLIGTGPFVFDEWVPNQRFVATKNPDYWATDAEGRQLPYLDEIEYRPIVEVAQRFNALQAGDITAMHTSDPLTVGDLRDLAEAGEVNTTESIEFGEVNYVMLNSSKPPFDNIKARQALAHAFDFEAYNAARGDGILTRATGPFAPGSVGNLDETELPDYDVEEAQRLVEEYEAETGQELRFTFTTTAAESPLADAQFWQQAAEAAGMELEIVTVDQSTQIDTALNGNFEAIGWRNHPGGDPDEQYVWWKSGFPTNFGRFADPEIDRLLDEGRANPDPEAREGLYEDLNRIFGEQVYNIWNYYTIWTVATAPDVHGVLGEGPSSAEPFPGLAVGMPPAYLWVEQ